MVGNEDAVDVLGRELEAGETLGQLGAAEALIDEHFCMGCFEQGRVSSAPCSQMRDGHGHANITVRARKGLEATGRCAIQGRILGP